ncbi:MAG: DNA-binding protein [Propionibacteriaceae bacterium]|nr:DNA-binding protein [Propionibacteriaceae bacterium]
MNERLMTDAQLAERWQTSRGTLANARSRGEGCPYLKLGGLVRYALADVLAYEEQCRRVLQERRQRQPSGID